jgi:GNAT superfamily N-acetyltransferase
MTDQIQVGEASCIIAPFDGDEELQDKVRFLTHLFVPEEHRKRGHATRLMESVCQQADDTNIALIVNPQVYDGDISQKKLIKFYEKFGFTQIQKKPLLLVRYPTQPDLTPKKPALAIVDAYGKPF